ncbi:MAG: DUF4981 domain-containing protein [Lachnospiraceae bacterium]|nr:DUF4981 domain-containing protein [Lachnospiraceae bacterium]
MKFDPKIIGDLSIFEQNRLPAHSDHNYCTCAEEAEAKGHEFTHTLNGTWKFYYAKNISMIPTGFFEESYDASVWQDIKVPAHIQMEGWGNPAYVNTQYPWDGSEELLAGQVPTRINPVGCYVRYFSVPDRFGDGPVCISFQGVESALALWINGKYIGYSEDAFTPSEFDITDAIRRGEENRIAVAVFRYTSSSWCDDQDFFRFSGIFRDVYIYTYPRLHVRDLRVETILDDKYLDATLRLTFDVTAKKGSAGKVSVTLTDKDGEEVAAGLEKIGSKETVLSLDVTEPIKWSAERPYLYDVNISVCDEKGDVVEYITEPVGFRRFEMIDNIMCINGRRIVFYGVDRHEFSANSGRVVSDEEILTDIVTMKQNNINAIRTSHYPNKSTLYRLCDTYGIYVIDETNFECHGYWDALQRGFHKLEDAVPGDREDFLPLMIDRARSMYERDKNHASILIWSLGNESYGGSMLLKMHDEIKKWDPSRLVHYEGVFWDDRYPETTDMISTMYRPVDEIAEVLKKDRSKPYISCEYAHAMGNSCGAIYKYTKLTEDEPLYQGGFIWDYIDQAIVTRDRHGVEYLGYGGDFGDRPNDGSFSGNGIVYGDDRSPSPKMQEVKFAYQPIKIEFSGDDIVITNKHLFTATDEYQCLMTLECEGELIDAAEGTIEVEPLSKKIIPIPFDLPDDDSGEYVLTVEFDLAKDTLWADAGHEIAYGQQVIGHMKPIEHKKKKMEVIHGWCNTGIRGEKFEILFSNLQAGPVSYKFGGREMIKLPPRPNFWRAMTENDTANLLPFRAGQWKLASMYLSPKYDHGREVTGYEVTEKDDTVTVSYTYHLPTQPAADCSVAYTVHSDGIVDVKLSMDGAQKLGELPEFGMIFTMDADYSHLKWYGLGPEETYADKNHAKLGVYENEVADNMARYLRPQECGNKERVRYATLSDDRGYGLLFVGEELSFSALPYTPHEIENANHPNELPPVHNTYVRVAKAQMGVGGDDTWGALVHPEYLLDTKGKLEFEFSFRGIVH